MAVPRQGQVVATAVPHLDRGDGEPGLRQVVAVEAAEEQALVPLRRHRQEGEVEAVVVEPQRGRLLAG